MKYPARPRIAWGCLVLTTLLLSILAAAVMPSTTDRVALAARAQGVPVHVALALMHHESRGRVGLTSSKGAQGPLQVIPRYWCPGGRAEGCDLVRAGVVALVAFRRGGSWEDAVCGYNAGNRCDAVITRDDGSTWVAGRDFARRVMATARRM